MQCSLPSYNIVITSMKDFHNFDLRFPSEVPRHLNINIANGCHFVTCSLFPFPSHSSSHSPPSSASYSSCSGYPCSSCSPLYLSISCTSSYFSSTSSAASSFFSFLLLHLVLFVVLLVLLILRVSHTLRVLYVLLTIVKLGRLILLKEVIGCSLVGRESMQRAGMVAMQHVWMHGCHAACMDAWLPCCMYTCIHSL